MKIFLLTVPLLIKTKDICNYLRASESLLWGWRENNFPQRQGYTVAIRVKVPLMHNFKRGRDDRSRLLEAGPSHQETLPPTSNFRCGILYVLRDIALITNHVFWVGALAK